MIESFRDKLDHRNDDIKNLGYDYKGNIFRNTLSSAMFIEENRSKILSKIEELVYFLIEHVKSIKKSYNYTYPKDFTNFN